VRRGPRPGHGSAPPEPAGYCHCTRGQKRTGTSSSAQCLCRECGSHLFSRNPDDAAQMSIRMRAFDGDPRVRPSVRTFVDSAAYWEPIPDDGLERFPESRPRPQF
jgi:hypothetical protein